MHVSKVYQPHSTRHRNCINPRIQHGRGLRPLKHENGLTYFHTTSCGGLKNFSLRSPRLPTNAGRGQPFAPSVRDDEEQHGAAQVGTARTEVVHLFILLFADMGSWHLLLWLGVHINMKPLHYKHNTVSC